MSRPTSESITETGSPEPVESSVTRGFIERPPMWVRSSLRWPRDTIAGNDPLLDLLGERLRFPSDFARTAEARIST